MFNGSPGAGSIGRKPMLNESSTPFAQQFQHLVALGRLRHAERAEQPRASSRNSTARPIGSSC